MSAKKKTRIDPSFRMFITMLVVIAVPVAITLFTVEHPNRIVPASSNPTPHGYTWSLLIIFQVCVLFGPTFVLFKTVRMWINWRAMSLSVMLMWLLSVIWETTLALPYGWWVFNKDQMLGIFIWGWHDLPIEEVILWTLAPWVTSMMYEAVRLFLHSQNTTRETLLGTKPVGVPARCSS